MMKDIFLLLIILPLIAVQLSGNFGRLHAEELTNFAAEKEFVAIRLEQPTQNLIDHIVRQDYEIIRLKDLEFVEIIVKKEQLPEFTDLGWEPEILFTEREMWDNLRLKTDELPGYRSYNDVLDELNDIVDSNPGIAALYNIGDSRGKEYALADNQNYADYAHDIWALKLTSNPTQKSDKPAVYYNGAHHARELISVEVVMHILWHLIDSYGFDPQITYLVDNTEIWFIPILNPDGHKIVIDQMNTNWRKNIRDNYNTGSISAGDGVDLNRNYSYEWQLTGAANSITYGGPFASSEPETIALRTLWQERHFLAGISYHSYGEYVLYPPGYTWNLVSPDVQAQSALAAAMAETIPRFSSPGHYTSQHSWQLYPATGTCEDDAYCNHGIFAHTLELATVFIPPADDVPQICQDNLEAALILLRRVHHSTLTGITTDHSSGDPIVTELFIPGIDDTGVYRVPYRSKEEYGRYYRLLLPGDYTIQFSAPGYFQTFLVSFSINDSTRTTLNQELVPLSIPVITEYFAGDQFIRLSWEVPGQASSTNDSETDEPLYRQSELEGFNIYRDELLVNPDSLLTGYIFYDHDLNNGTAYSYEITAVYPEGESFPSDTVTIIPQSGTVISPETITLTLDEEILILQWEPVENAIGYRIYAASDPLADDWAFLDYVIDREWVGGFSESMKFFRITAVY